MTTACLEQHDARLTWRLICEPAVRHGPTPYVPPTSMSVGRGTTRIHLRAQQAATRFLPIDLGYSAWTSRKDERAVKISDQTVGRPPAITGFSHYDVPLEGPEGRQGGRTTQQGAERHDQHQLCAHLAKRVLRRQGEARSRASVSGVFHGPTAVQAQGSPSATYKAYVCSCCQLASPCSVIPREQTNQTRKHGQCSKHMFVRRIVGAPMTARLYSSPSWSLAFIDVTPGGLVHGIRRLRLHSPDPEARLWHRLAALCSSDWGSESACRQKAGRQTACRGQQRHRLAAAAVVQQPAAPAAPTVVTYLRRKAVCTSISETSGPGCRA